VEYCLTSFGCSFLEPMQQLVDWADTHHRDIVAARMQYKALQEQGR